MLEAGGKGVFRKTKIDECSYLGRRTSVQDLMSQVGRISSEHVELLEARMSFLTSSRDAGEKIARAGGGAAGGI